MQRHANETRIRLQQLAAQMHTRIYPEIRPVDSLKVSPASARISHQEAHVLDYRPSKLGEQFGPQFATFWFRIEASIPKEWQGRRVDFLWHSNSEATLWLNGQPVQGLNVPYGDRPDAVLTHSAKANEKLSLEVEMACNTIYGIWLEPKSPHISPYLLERCEIALFDAEAWQLYFDFSVLQELEAELSTEAGTSDKAFAGQLLYELNAFANQYELSNRSTWAPAQKILQKLLKLHNGSVTHNVFAIGHAHLDIAWLWPIEETYRKSIRTTANQLAYMEDYPDFSFVFSQAHLYAVMKERQPELYKKLKAAANKGKWIPVGGTWVEPDCNLPSGESLARQFLFGQRFFQKEFGKRCKEFWNPDVFGYNGQLPQIMKLSGVERFVTTKLDWNRFNKPAHQTFKWQGIDGSSVLAHFPLAEMFNSKATVKEIRGLAAKFKDNDFSSHSMLLYGHGDGGGGPTKAMIETIRRCKDLQGVPRTQMRTPDEFFALLEKELDHLPIIVGELYLEYHRGTYTSQAAVKKRMRQCEFLLHDIEFLSAIALRLGLLNYPSEELNRLWQLLLVIQFHDIIPGTSIAPVYDDVDRDFVEIEETGKRLRHAAALAVAGAVTPDSKVKPAKGTINAQSQSQRHIPINTTSFSRRQVTDVPDGTLAIVEAPPYGIGNSVTVSEFSTSGRGAHSAPSQFDDSNKSRRDARAPRSKQLTPSPSPTSDTGTYGAAAQSGISGRGTPCVPADAVTAGTSTVHITEHKNTVILENDNLRAEFSKTGLLNSLLEKESKRESLAGQANRLQIYHDHPAKYDAWELDAYHLETVKDCPPAHSHKVSSLPLRVEVHFEYQISNTSTMTQIVRLDAESRQLEFHCTVDWHEAHKVLKVMFPVNVRAMNATYEMQFGWVERPTHYNTTYDLARFEVPAHKWADLSEHGFGVALLSDCKYGFSTYGNEMRLTLLRAPKEPDPNTDMGRNEFAYALMPHIGSWQDAGVVAAAYHFNVPMLWSEAPLGNPDPAPSTSSFVSLDDANLVLDTIKKAEDSDALILRLYECHGSHGKAKLAFALPFKSAHFSNILEDEGDAVPHANGIIEIPYTPFQIITLKLA
jgi:alpha-mannosidase